MAPKRKITVDLPSTKKSRERSDRIDRPSNDKSREHSRNSDKDRTERNTAPDREDSNRSSERERTSNKMSSGNASNMFPNERNSQRDRDRDNKDRSAETTQHRASVFSRLGKGPLNAPSSSNSNTSQQKGICRPWADTGHCPYGNECRFKHISNLVSPSKKPSGSHDNRDAKEKERDGLNRSGGHREDNNERVDNKERHRQSGGDRDQIRTSTQLSKESGRKEALRPGNKMSLAKHNLAGKLGGKMKTDSPLIDPNWENWDEDNLDYDDELMLEKKRQLLQRELEKQMAVDGGASADASTIAPGSSIKGQKGATSTNIQTSGPHQPNATRNKSTSKKSLEDKSSSSSTSSSSSSDSGSSSGSSSSTESSDESEVGSTGISKKKDKNKASTSRGMLSSGIGIPGSKSAASAGSFQSSKHRDRSSRASSISSSETKRKKKDRSGRSSRVGSKKSRNSIGRSKSSTGSKIAGVSKRDKKRPDRKSKNFSSKHSSSKREDVRGKSPRHGKRDKPSLSSERSGMGKDSRNRRSSHSPPQPNSNKKRRLSGHSEERSRDHKFDRERMGSSRENKNSYTSTTGAGGSGRDRDLRRSEFGNMQSGSSTRDYINRDEKHDSKGRDFQRGNTNFEARGKFGRDTINDTNKDRWGGSRNEMNRNNDRRSNEGNSFEHRREGHHGERNRRPIDRSITPRDPEKSRAGYNRTPPHGFKNQREEWDRSPLGEKNRDNWDDNGSMWNRERGSSPTDRRKGSRQISGSSGNVLSGANSVPVKADPAMQRRGKSPFGGRDRSNRSRSRERLLPPNALDRSTGNINEHRDNNRSDRKNTHDRDRSPRMDRNIRTNEDHIDRRRSPRASSRGSTDRFSQRRERGGDSYEERHDRDGRNDTTRDNDFARMDRSRSRESRIVDKFAEGGTVAGKIDKVQSESLTKYTNTSKSSNTLTSPNRCSTSPSRQNIDKKFNIESKVATHGQQSETAAEYGSNQMGTEEYSDFDSDSGEELLYDMRDEKEEKEAAIQSNDEGEKLKDNGMESNDKETDESASKLQDDYIDEQSDKVEKRNKHDGLLEGISDEELDDVSEEENAEKNGQSAKLADALGVDWSQLVELQQKHKNQEDLEDPTKSTVSGTDEKEAQARARKKYWTPIAIFNRIGLPRSFLSDSFYNSFVKQLNENAEDGEKLELLHENAGYHMQLKEQRERRKNLFVNGPYSRPMLARQEIAIRRELCGLPKEEYCAMPVRPNTDMELWNKAVELMLDEDDPTSKEVISESSSSSKMTQVF